jgi:hypothetical protein
MSLMKNQFGRKDPATKRDRCSRTAFLARILAGAVLLLAVAGCVPKSLNPLFSDKELVEEDVLVGNWNEITVESLGNKTYHMKDRSGNGPPSAPANAKFRVLKLGDHHFVDLEGPGGLHEFIRIAIFGDRLYSRNLPENWVKARCQQFPGELAHRIDRQVTQQPNGKPIVAESLTLTAETADLQSFVLRFINDPAAFGGMPIGSYSKVGGIPIQASGLASKKYRTFNYWYEFRMACYSCSPSKNATPDVAAANLEELSKAISDLPTVGVDLAAAECATDAARLFSSMAAAIRDGNGGDRLLESFLRGLAGDPFGVLTEQVEAHRQTSEQLSSFRERFQKVRVLLTDRYEIEFPAI